jgi:hypothetical protein
MTGTGSLYPKFSRTYVVGEKMGGRAQPARTPFFPLEVRNSCLELLLSRKALDGILSGGGRIGLLLQHL